MIVATLKLQQDVKAAMDEFIWLRNEALGLFNVYWKTSVNTDLAAISSGSDPACFSARLTKAQLSASLTLADQVGNVFFENGSVSQADYLATCQSLLYGNAAATLVSQPLEGYANRAVEFARRVLAQYNLCRVIEVYYGAAKIYDAVAALDSSSVVFGAEFTKDELLSAIGVIHQWQLLLENQAVASGFYRTAITQWLRF